MMLRRLWQKPLEMLGLRNIFACMFCGVLCDVAHDDGPVCPSCCTDQYIGHDFEYDRDIQAKACIFCGERRPYDYD